MKKVTIIALCLAFIAGCTGVKERALDSVDMTIGSVGYLLEPAISDFHLPNQMVRMVPRYGNFDDVVDGYCLNMGSYRFMYAFMFLPFEGQDCKGGQVMLHEQMKPYYYSVELGDSYLLTEFTPAARSGFFRLTFNTDEPHMLRFAPMNAGGELNLTEDGAITGVEHYGTIDAYFYAVPDDKVVSLDPLGNARVARLEGKSKTVNLRYGFSYISIEQAKANLEKEIGSRTFDEVCADAEDIWDKAMSIISVKGGSEKHTKVFNTALWRFYERMVDVSEYGRYWSAADKSVHEIEGPFYMDNWIWDQYVAMEPLYAIFYPDQEAAKIRSYIEMYRLSGTMPSFAMTMGDVPCMVGNFAAVWMLDCWNKGIRDFDLETALEGLKINSLERTLLPWRNGPKCRLDDFYNEHGWYPGLRPGEVETEPLVEATWERRQCVSLSTVGSYADWAIAEMAKELGKADDEALFRKRAMFYKNVYNPETGFMQPRDEKGDWIEPFNPITDGRAYYTENNAYIYNWDVKHDFDGLFELMGGKAAAEKKLDEMFRADIPYGRYRFWRELPDHTGLVGVYSVANEPCFHIPYIYDYTGSPWKTQFRIHQILDGHFTDEIIGIPGDEDGGAMSAFLVFSMMGFFPVSPGIPEYAIGSPFFEEATLNLPSGKKFTVKAENFSEENIYVQKAILNGKELDRPFITHDDLLSGGTLTLEMGYYPKK